MGTRVCTPSSGEVAAAALSDEATLGLAPSEHLVSEEWDQPRWLRILERMEHRQWRVGLRFWGPPLWLEVTMTGPDSDAWWRAPAMDLPDQAWNWESMAPSSEAMRLAGAGAMMIGSWRQPVATPWRT